MFRTQVKMPLITVVLVSLMVIGCCVAAAEEERFGGTLRVAIIGEPTGLDMFHAYGVNPWKIFQHIVEPLFEYDAEWQPVPHLLDSYTAEDNNTRYILNLRKGVMFHNGKEMKAEDVDFVLQYETELVLEKRCRVQAHRNEHCRRLHSGDPAQQSFWPDTLSPG